MVKKSISSIWKAFSKVLNAFLGSQGHQTTFRQVFADWIVANYVDQFQPTTEDPHYRYADLDISTPPTRLLDAGNTLEAMLPQFASEYVQLRGLSGHTRISFKEMCARFDVTPPGIRHGAPLLGQHSDEILGEIGVSGERIAALRADGVIEG